MPKQPEKPAHISQQDWDDADIPELTDAELARMRPFREVFPEFYEAWKKYHRRQVRAMRHRIRPRPLE